MQREIKFRVWDSRRKKMFYQTDESEWCSKWFIEYDYYPDFSCLSFLLNMDENPTGYRMDNEIQQYTGLKDKNGKDVYEGDIVYVTAPRQDEEWSVRNGNYPIEWNQEEARFGIKDGEYWECPVDWWETLKIVGNRFEHPELLNK